MQLKNPILLLIWGKYFKNLSTLAQILIYAKPVEEN